MVLKGRCAIESVAGLSRHFSSLCALLVFFALTPFISSNAQAANKNAVYFFNPESNINNFSSLKGAFDSYLESKGDYYFQPFKDAALFEQACFGNLDGVCMISSWHYSSLPKKVSEMFKPRLIAVSNRSTTYQKSLIVASRVKHFDDLAGMTIASTGSLSFNKKLLKEILGEKYEVLIDKIKILKVPKDIDAVMSVSFGMAQGALATNRTLAKLKKINPKQLKSLHSLGHSQDISLPIIIAPTNKDGWSRKLTTEIEKMSQTTSGLERLNMLGLDGWKVIEQTQ